jgi:adenylosuccinate synthase
MSTGIIVIGMGFGDEGKGKVVDHLCRLADAKLVVRFSGGQQAAHTVVTKVNGRTVSHVFSQFGSGTFHGAKTYLSRYALYSPTAATAEAEALHRLGIVPGNIQHMLSVDWDALVSTPYDFAYHRLRLGRPQAHDSCGAGTHATHEYYRKYGMDAIFARDLTDPSTLEAKLGLQYVRYEVPILQRDPRMPNHLTESWHPRDVARLLYDRLLHPAIFKGPPVCNDTVIFEGSQGVLLDEYRGFQPTPFGDLTTLNAFAVMHEMPEITNFSCVGVTRAYAYRHGTGALPTERELSRYTVKPESNEWQGSTRVGSFDTVLFAYALNILGCSLDGLFVNHVDQCPPQLLVRDVSPELRKRYVATLLCARDKPYEALAGYGRALDRSVSLAQLPDLLVALTDERCTHIAMGFGPEAGDFAPSVSARCPLHTQLRPTMAAVGKWATCTSPVVGVSYRGLPEEEHDTVAQA